MTKEELKEWEQEFKTALDIFKVDGLSKHQMYLYVKDLFDLYKKELVERIQKIHPIAIISQGTPIEEGLVSKEKVISIINEK